MPAPLILMRSLEVGHCTVTTSSNTLHSCKATISSLRCKASNGGGGGGGGGGAGGEGGGGRGGGGAGGEGGGGGGGGRGA